MNVSAPAGRRLLLLLAGGVLATALAACGGSRTNLPTEGSVDADKFLFDRGTEELKKGNWLIAREYFQRLFDTYPQSTYRRDAKLGIGDSYLGESRTDSHILAANEFREYLTFYPLSERADYAQYKLAESQVRQMLSPDRDQTATIDALRELDTFIKNYPNSALMPEVLQLRRQARDRLSEHEFRVGRHYFRTRWYPGAVARLQALLEIDPGFTHKDAVYFYLGETYYRTNQKEQALSYYKRLVDEYAVSEHLEDARARLAELTPADGSGPPSRAAAPSEPAPPPVVQ